MRVLIVWCHGGNWGHVARQLAFAQHATAIGAEMTWAVPARHADAMAPVRARGYRVLAHTESLAPLVSGRSRPSSYADLLCIQGFGDPAALEAQARMWLDLYARVKPDRVVIDYAPVAQFACQLVDLPAVQLTNGFDSPPANCPPYEAGMRGPYLWQQAAAQVQRVEQTIETVAARLAPSISPGLDQLLEYPHRLLDCVEESDPYAPRGPTGSARLDYVGPLGEVPDAAPPQWPLHPGAVRVLAYLRGMPPQADGVLTSLAARGAAVLCVWPDAPPLLVGRYAGSPSTRIVHQPVRVADALAEADAVVSYASSTFTCQALLAGKPQLMLPVDHEKALVGRRLASLGLGLLCEGGEPTSRADELTEALLEDKRLLHGAAAVAARHAGLAARAASMIAAAVRSA